MLREITVPAAGNKLPFPFTGNSIIIVSAAAYQAIEETPKVSFDTSSNQFPGITRSIYGNPAGRFNKLYVEGTEASAGDALTIYSTPLCLDDYINIDALQTTRATLKPTFSITIDDTVKELTELQIINNEGQLPAAMYITSRGTKAAYAFEADPAISPALGHVLNEDETQKIIGINFIESFRFIDAQPATGGDMSFTMEY